MRAIENYLKGIALIMLYFWYIIYVVGIFAIIFLLKMQLIKEPLVVFLIIVLVYNCHITSFFCNLGQAGEYKESVRSYFDFFFITIINLAGLLFFRFSFGSLLLDFFLASILLVLLGYSRSYLYLEEFMRLTSATISVSLQILFQVNTITTIMSMVFFIIYGRLGMELITKYLLTKEFLQLAVSQKLFYFFLAFYVKLKNYRKTRIKAILFNLLLFTIIPNFWVFFFLKYVYLGLFFSSFLLIVMIANTVYCKLVSDPCFAIFFLEKLMSRYPEKFGIRIMEIVGCVMEENYYVLDDPEYLTFSGEGWLVIKYLQIKAAYVKIWATSYQHVYKERFITGFTRDDLETKLDELLLSGIEYMKLTGNVNRNEKNACYGLGMELLRENSREKRELFFFCADKEQELEKLLALLDHSWLITLEVFNKKNAGKGLQSEGLLRNLSVAMNWARLWI